MGFFADLAVFVLLYPSDCNSVYWYQAPVVSCLSSEEITTYLISEVLAVEAIFMFLSTASFIFVYCMCIYILLPDLLGTDYWEVVAFMSS